MMLVQLFAHAKPLAKKQSDEFAQNLAALRDNFSVPCSLPAFLFKLLFITVDKLVKSHCPVFVIPANAGIQENQSLLDSRSPIRSRTSFAGVTALETFYETIKVGNSNLWGCKKMKVRRLIVVSVLVQLAFLTGANGDNGFPVTSSNEESAKERGMEDKDRLTEEEGKYLLSVARKTIDQALSGKEGPEIGDSDLPALFDEQRGTFVTLTIGGNLRGCIGHIIPQEALIEGIRINAINAAFKDPRFRPLNKNEWKRVKIEISILTEPKSLSYSDADDLLKKLRSGIDGVIIKKGYHQSTFLPQVWEQLPRKEEFLNHLCLKAGLDEDEWKKGRIEVSTYQAQAFEE